MTEVVGVEVERVRSRVVAVECGGWFDSGVVAAGARVAAWSCGGRMVPCAVSGLDAGVSGRGCSARFGGAAGDVTWSADVNGKRAELPGGR